VKKNQAFFEFSDILADEIELLEEKIEMFNTQTVFTSNCITNIFDNKEIKSTGRIESSLTVADYIKAVSDNFYNEDDSVLFVLTAE